MARGLAAVMTSRLRISPVVTKGWVRASGQRRTSLSVGHHGSRKAMMRRGMRGPGRAGVSRVGAVVG